MRFLIILLSNSNLSNRKSRMGNGLETERNSLVCYVLPLIQITFQQRYNLYLNPNNN